MLNEGGHGHPIGARPSYTLKGQDSVELEHRAGLIITTSQQGEVVIEKNRYGPCPERGKTTTGDLSEICVNLISKHLFKNNFNVFKAVFEDDLRAAIEEVLRFHGMRTSKKNHKKFSREMKGREAL